MHYRAEHKLRLCAFVINLPALRRSTAPGRDPSPFGPSPSPHPLLRAAETANFLPSLLLLSEPEPHASAGPGNSK